MRRSLHGFVLGLLLLGVPASAQLTAPDPLACITVIIHEVVPDKVWVMGPDYVLGPAAPGDYIAIGWGAETTATILGDASWVDVMHANTETPVAELGIAVFNANVTTQLMTADPTRSWRGYLAPVTGVIVGPVLVDLHIEADVGVIPSIAALEAESLSSAFGSGGADIAGNATPSPFDIAVPTDVIVIDERTAVGLGAPVADVAVLAQPSYGVDPHLVLHAAESSLPGHGARPARTPGSRRARGCPRPWGAVVELGLPGREWRPGCGRHLRSAFAASRGTGPACAGTPAVAV